MGRTPIPCVPPPPPSPEEMFRREITPPQQRFPAEIPNLAIVFLALTPVILPFAWWLS